MGDNRVLNSLEKIHPVTVYQDRLIFLEYLFYYSLRINEYDTTNYSPSIKLAFIGNGNNILDRLFVVEETESMILMVKNVSVPPKNVSIKNEPYKRSAYIMMRQAFKFVHFDTGYIFNDLLDYCHIEPERISNYIYFVYEDNRYENIKDISSKDDKYKSKVRIFTNNNMEITNNINFYIQYIGYSEIKSKIGYYISNESIKYFHVMSHLKENFGSLENIETSSPILISDPTKFLYLINTVLNTITSESVIIDDESRSRCKKQKKKVTKETIGFSLVTKLKEQESNQNKRIAIGWFICEVLYQFFFRS